MCVDLYPTLAPSTPYLDKTACKAGADCVAASLTIQRLVAYVEGTGAVAGGLGASTVVWAPSCDGLVNASGGRNDVGLEAAYGGARVVPYVTIPGCVFTVLIAVQVQNCSIGGGEECRHGDNGL